MDTIVSVKYCRSVDNSVLYTVATWKLVTVLTSALGRSVTVLIVSWKWVNVVCSVMVV